MRPVEHFYSKLALLENSRRDGGGIGGEDREYVIREFTRLTAPVLGGGPAEDFCRRTLDRAEGSGKQGSLQRLAAAAAFFLGEYDDTIPLEPEDWEDIRETLDDVSGDIDLTALTSLMGDLLSRGKLH